jgi:hypothetical protein
MKASEKIFHRYKHLVPFYANKIFDEHKIGFNKQDLQQELSIKLIKSIRSYGKRWLEYRNTGLNKPIPIKFYLKLCLVNKVKDIIKDITRQKISFHDEFNFDYGVENDVKMDFKSKDVTINGIDLFHGIKGKNNKIVFSMFLKGYTIQQISLIFKKTDKQINPSQIIRNQQKFLESHKNTLFQSSRPMFVKSFDDE